jgi:hypothetical protein
MPARALVLATVVVTGTGLGAIGYQAAHASLAQTPPAPAVQTPSGAARAASPAPPDGGVVADPCTLPTAGRGPSCTVVVSVPAPAAASTPTDDPTGSAEHADGHVRHDGSDDGSARPSGTAAGSGRPRDDDGAADVGDGDGSGRPGHDRREDVTAEDRSGRSGGDDDRREDTAEVGEDNGGDVDRDGRVEPGDDRDLRGEN